MWVGGIHKITVTWSVGRLKKIYIVICGNSQDHGMVIFMFTCDVPLFLSLFVCYFVELCKTTCFAIVHGILNDNSDKYSEIARQMQQ